MEKNKTTIDWKEEFDKKFYDSNLECVSLHDTSPDSITDFIETQLEKLIQETELLIAEDWATEKYPIEECLNMSTGVVKQLRSKWLSK